jgi:hypothetical protein
LLLNGISRSDSASSKKKLICVIVHSQPTMEFPEREPPHTSTSTKLEMRNSLGGNSHLESP